MSCSLLSFMTENAHVSLKKLNMDWKMFQLCRHITIMFPRLSNNWLKNLSLYDALLFLQILFYFSLGVFTRVTNSSGWYVSIQTYLLTFYKICEILLLQLHMNSKSRLFSQYVYFWQRYVNVHCSKNTSVKIQPFIFWPLSCMASTTVDSVHLPLSRW